MTSYGLTHVVAECLSEKANVTSKARGATTGAKTEIYDRSWAALNAWIESRLCKQKGAQISGFGTFAWELKSIEGETHARPIFIISDVFAKNFRVKRQRIHKAPHLSSLEEVNYSLLAIKFSKALTKDMVFSGVRDILKKIGDFIYRGYEVEIEFSFGTLRAKEQRVRFDFSQARLQQILPEVPMPVAGVFSYDEARMDYIDDAPDSGRRPGSAGTDATAMRNALVNSMRPSTADVAAAPAKGAPPLNLASLKPAGGTGIAFRADATGGAGSPTSSPSYRENEELEDEGYGEGRSEGAFSPSRSYPGGVSSELLRSSYPEDIRELLSTLETRRLGVSKNEWRRNVCDRVTEQAYLRCLADVETSAQQDDSMLLATQARHDEWKAGLRHERERLRDQVLETKTALDLQMADKEAEHAREQLDKLAPSRLFFLPENAGMSSGQSLGADNKIISGRVKISKDLEAQIRRNAEGRVREKAETATREREYLRQLAMETDLQQVMRRASDLEKQRALLEAWERDGHIRNLKKLQPFGTRAVKEYVQRNLADPMVMTSTSTLAAASPTIGSRLSMSIGYDPRRGKV